MSEYDLRCTDSYALHLAAVNQTREVLATEDIRNERGVLLVRKGHAIKAETAQRLLNHRLLQPLETSINVSNALDPKSLYRNTIELLAQDAQSHAIHNALHLDPLLKQLSLQMAHYPLIVQKLTVMSVRMPQEYHKALYCAWFSIALAQQLRWDVGGSSDAFFAGLTQNVGLLHIDPAVATKSGTYTPEEWRAVQSHPLIGEVFLSHVTGLSAEVRQAVREHHERCDGSGYPAALCDNRLGLLGQVIAMADTVWGLCKNTGKRKCESLADVLTVIKMNKAQFPPPVESALYHLHLRALHGLSKPVPLDSKAVPDLLILRQQLRQLKEQYGFTAPLQALLTAETKESVTRSAYVKYQRIWFVVNGSGLLNEDLLSPLAKDNADGTPCSRPELHDLSLMYSELQWQLFQLERTLDQVHRHSSILHPNVKADIAAVLRSLHGLSQTGVPAEEGVSDGVQVNG